VRINLGLVQPDIDIFWDLAAHDLSILDFILPDGYLTLPLTGGAIAHIHVNWLSPTKIRTTIVGGSRRIAVWETSTRRSGSACTTRAST
jgi:hypothetical protein